MKIKSFMDFLSRDSEGRPLDVADSGNDSPADETSDEKVIYIENARLETLSDQERSRSLLSGGTQWSDKSMGDILVGQGKLSDEDVERIIEHQSRNGLYFGEAAVQLDLVDQDDILKALSTQFGYTYSDDGDDLSKDMVMAFSPFGEQAEEIRAIRAALVSGWLRDDQKVLSIVSPQAGEGRSYIAANLAMAFSQLGRSTLLIDADMRSPSQHKIFKSNQRIGLSMLLAGRVNIDDLDALPDQISNFQYLSVLSCGALPPNPVELLSGERFPVILREIKRYFDVIIIDTPPGTYKADVAAIAQLAGSALIVARSGHTVVDNTKNLVTMLNERNVNVVGSVLNTI